MPLDKDSMAKTLVALNVIFLLTGCASVAIGIWTLFDPGLFDVFFGIYKFLHPASMLIAAGVLTVFTTMCGIGGARKQNKCLIRMYIVFLVLVMVVEMVAGGLAFSYRRTVKAEISNHTMRVVREKYGSGDREMDYALDLLQEKFQCCGADGAGDYDGSVWTTYNKVPGKSVPETCCQHPAKCVKQTVESEVFTQGCKQKLNSFVEDHYLVIGGVGLGSGCVQLVIVVVAFIFNHVLTK